MTVSIVTPPTAVRMRRHAWRMRVRDALSAYLPLLLMVLLALATWWLVQNSPQPIAPAAPREARHEPDYAMRGVLLQRFDAEGALRAQVEGQSLRHFPDDDAIEVDDVRIRLYDAQGRITRAAARLALTTGKTDVLQLVGGARVENDGTATTSEPMVFESEYLHVDIGGRKIRSHRPVTLRVGASEVRASGLAFAEATQVAQLDGPLHATLDPRLAQLQRSGAPAAARTASAVEPRRP